MVKKLFLFLFISILFISCDECNKLDFKLCSYRVVIIDGHDYIAYKSGYGLGFCHSESCKNPKHYGN